jgi:tRNA pseudouridine38-40 synthase
VGRHDFLAFTAAGHDRETTVRTIHACAVEEHEAHGFEFAPAPVREVHIIVQGDGFLYNMVRIIAGTLVDVGRGAMQSEEIAGVIASCDRRQAGPTLPPQGLCLEWIRYDDAAAEPAP